MGRDSNLPTLENAMTAIVDAIDTRLTVTFCYREDDKTRPHTMCLEVEVFNGMSDDDMLDEAYAAIGLNRQCADPVDSYRILTIDVDAIVTKRVKTIQVQS